ncbi:MAG: holo-ACP synthase [Bdellovibrionales bacterium]
MILGIGSDIVDIERIRKVWERHKERFVKRVFTAGEQATAARRADPIPTYAKRFAAKEACAKALGTGLGRGVGFADIEVVNLKGGKPTLRLHNAALTRLKEMAGLPADCAEPDLPRLHISISDERDYAQAFVVIEMYTHNNSRIGNTQEGSTT